MIDTLYSDTLTDVAIINDNITDVNIIQLKNIISTPEDSNKIFHNQNEIYPGSPQEIERVYIMGDIIEVEELTNIN